MDVADFHRALVHALRAGDVAVAREAVIVHYLGNDDEEGAPDAATLAGVAEVIEAMAKPGRRFRDGAEDGRPEVGAAR